MYIIMLKTNILWKELLYFLFFINKMFNFYTFNFINLLTIAKIWSILFTHAFFYFDCHCALFLFTKLIIHFFDLDFTCLAKPNKDLFF